MRFISRNSFFACATAFTVSTFANKKLLQCSAAASTCSTTKETCSKVSDAVLTKYATLEEKLKEIERLNGVHALLKWDSEVMMKDGSFPARNELSNAIAGVIYEKQSAKELGELIDDLTKSNLSSLPSDYERANVRDAKRDFECIARKSKELTVRENNLIGEAYPIWVNARKENNFESFQDKLKAVIDIKKEIAKVSFPELSAYDGNVELFERGMKAARLTDIFNGAKKEIVPLIKDVLATKKNTPYVIPDELKGGPQWNTDKQKEMCNELAEAIGFDFNKGRFDVSVHPFTSGSHPTDVRITTRYSEGNWLEGIGGTIHEVGHALYEQGRNEKYDSTPVSRALSMGVHESQSLFWERMVFQSREFWIFATPVVHKYFPHTKNVTAEDFYTFVNQVEPDFIRIEADELTYPLHIILRFELEQGLFEDKIEVKELPTLWNKKMYESLGVVVSEDKPSKGVLQDIHWAYGAFGYFPSYSLGAMIAAQLHETALKELPDMREQIARGEFKPVREWLRKNIHEVGSLYDNPDELLVRVTGKPLDSKFYCDYLKHKYSDIYKLK